MMSELNALKDVLMHKTAQKGLIALYANSQKECTRNGTCGMEIGMAREKDMCAVLKLHLGDAISLDIDNTLPEDFLLHEQKVSIKHSQAKIGSPVKAKWTSADKSVQEAITFMIDAADDYYPHLLLVYMDIKSKKITICCISSEHNRTTIKGLGKSAFKVPTGNSRGIEYSTAAMKELMRQCYFVVEITDADLTGGMDPIERRMKELSLIDL
jgi:hypothetical protein